MEWNPENFAKLTSLFREKWRSMQMESSTDRANFSAIWNRYLTRYDAVIFRNNGGSSNSLNSKQTLDGLIELINFKHDEISGRLIVANPDRAGQWILIPRDIAERILVLGMML
jgi:hypothetical protein